VAILQWLVVFFNAGVVIEHYAEVGHSLFHV
jgi:hypothetical protein